MSISQESLSSVNISMLLIRDSLDEATLCEKLEKHILTTAHSIYSLTSVPNVLMYAKPDGTPVAQLVVFDSSGTLVLMEGAGLSPAKTVFRGRSIAMENLLAIMEAVWASVCRTPRNMRVSGLYYVPKPMGGIKGTGMEKE